VWLAQRHRTRSRPRSASSPRNSIPIRTLTTPKPKPGSRKSARRTTSSRNEATGPSGPTTGGSHQGFAHFADGDLGDLGQFNDLFEHIFARAGGRGGFGWANTGSGGANRARKGGDVETSVEIEIADIFTGTTAVVTSYSGNEPSRLKVNIPAGIGNGDKLRVKSHGKKGANGGDNGDLVITVNIKPMDDFAIDGHDVHTYLDIPFAVALAGGTIEIKKVDGSKHRAMVEPFPGPERELAVRGAGLPIRGTGRFGDLVIHLAAVMPTKVTAKQKKLLAEFAALSDSDAYNSTRMAKVKSVGG
jgi:molecular chaperone DnaJ